MNKYYLFFIVTVLAYTAQGQSKDPRLIELIYKSAKQHLENNKLLEANADFEKIIMLDPDHIDALYSLAIISDKFGDTSSAIRFLRRCVRLNDREAAKLLISKFNYRLSYADTMQNIDISTREKYLKLKSLQASSLSDLSNKILSLSSNKKEQLHMLLLWTYDNLAPDSVRFFDGGSPLSNNDVFVKGMGLCDEYSNVMAEFCRIANIPNFKVAGYVKYPEFSPGDVFSEANHAWNAVYLDSSWVLCDLFWATVALRVDNLSTPHFMKRLETNYFLALPTAFINDHLPCDPVFQFSHYPIVMSSFTNTIDGIDTTMQRMKYLNYRDSLALLSKMNLNDQMLRIAYHSYEYNKSNPNDMIADCYNYSVNILNKKTSTKQELGNARRSLVKALEIIDTSNHDDIKALRENCKAGIEIINRRLLNK